MVRVQTHQLEEPVHIRLPTYPALHRVYGVEYRRNPSGIGSKRRVYAITEWQLPGTGRWDKVRDLVLMMRLASHIEHPFPKNTESYAVAW